MPFPVDAKWITKSERRLNVRFPASFVVAMTRMNGGSFDTGNDNIEYYSFIDKLNRKRI
ncbi:hypothetical protein N9L06_04825 [Mariniblastus sp.]|nr:hypothetical protein [Mariniblastus sp.]